MIKAIIFDVGGVLKKNFFVKNKAVYEIIDNLKQRNYKVAICSNTSHIHKFINIINKIYEPFEIKVLSCDVGISKPNPQIYKLTLNKLKITPKEAIFIDNSETNTNSAKKIGINEILFHNSSQLKQKIEELIQ